MNHPFMPSLTNEHKCARCPYDALTHTNMAVCEACSNIGPVNPVFGGILMCVQCEEKERAIMAANNTPEKQQERIDTMNAAIAASRKIDDSINVRTDLFNAATVAIVDLKKSIDEDASITNKPYALAEELTRRFQHFKTVVFELNEKIVEAGNQQKAIQIYLNQLANTLRAEEREKLKIADINYKPVTVKQAKPNTIKVRSSKKLDKAELKKYATELGVSEFTLQMLVTAKGITVEAAANMLRKSVNEAKSESANSK